MNYKQKLISWLPKHFTNEQYDIYLEIVDIAFNDLRKNMEEMFRETYISQAETDFLEIHGRERGMRRVVYAGNVNETDENFANRIRRIKYNRTKANIINNVQSVIGLTDVQVRNDIENGSFLEGVQDKRALKVNISGDEYGNYGPLDLKLRHNCFSVLVETPVPPPLAHYDDNSFYDDAAFMDERARIFDASTAQVIKTLIKQKSPAGAGFRLLIKGFTGLTIGNEQSQEDELNSI